ncbi:hypothetical protein SK128_009962, partial [Halocaridina rubra]
SRYSLECSIDEVSSLGGVGGSRASLANTSLTSAADLSTLSSVTLARRGDIDAASIQSGRSLMSPDARSVQSVRSPRSPTDKFRHSNSHSPAQSQQTGGDERADLRSVGSESEIVHNGVLGSPSHSPSTPRPSCLSVSQTTLQGGETLQSEPATPKASETPDTVRIFVPYSGNLDSLTPLTSHVPMSPTLGDIKRVPSSPGDPNRIMIHVDGDDSLSSPRSSAVSNSPREMTSFTSLDLSSQKHSVSVHDINFTSEFSPQVKASPAPVSPSLPKLETARSHPITLDSPEYKEGLL